MSIVFPVWLTLGTILTVGGVGAWALQLRRGMAVTSLSNAKPWGTYIAGFIFFMGLSAGALVLAALPLIFDLPSIRPYAGISALVALASLIIGGLFILADVGRPTRVWRMVVHGKIGSPMTWDLLLTAVYGVVSLVMLVAILADAPSGLLTGVAWVALAAGIADGLTAFVFATQVARDFWLSAVQPLAFFVAALSSAGAVLQLLVVGLRPSGYVDLAVSDLGPLALMTAGCLGISLLLLLSEAVTAGFAHTERGLRTVKEMVGSPLLWIEVGAALGAIGLYVVPGARASSAGLAIASVMTIVHLVAKRLHFVDMGFAVPTLELRGVDIDKGRGGSILAHPVELTLSAGLAGGFIVLLSVGLSVLPLGI